MTKPAAHADALILALGAAFDLALATERAVLAAVPEMPDAAIDNRVVDAFCGPASAICSLIQAQEPKTAAGWAVRARVWTFLQGADETREAA